MCIVIESLSGGEAGRAVVYCLWRPGFKSRLTVWSMETYIAISFWKSNNVFLGNYCQLNYSIKADHSWPFACTAVRVDGYNINFILKLVLTCIL